MSYSVTQDYSNSMTGFLLAEFCFGSQRTSSNWHFLWALVASSSACSCLHEQRPEVGAQWPARNYSNCFPTRHILSLLIQNSLTPSCPYAPYYTCWKSIWIINLLFSQMNSFIGGKQGTTITAQQTTMFMDCTAVTSRWHWGRAWQILQQANASYRLIAISCTAQGAFMITMHWLYKSATRTGREPINCIVSFQNERIHSMMEPLALVLWWLVMKAMAVLLCYNWALWVWATFKLKTSVHACRLLQYLHDDWPLLSHEPWGGLDKVLATRRNVMPQQKPSIYSLLVAVQAVSSMWGLHSSSMQFGFERQKCADQ